MLQELSFWLWILNFLLIARGPLPSPDRVKHFHCHEKCHHCYGSLGLNVMVRILHTNVCCHELLCIIHHLTLTALLSLDMSLISAHGCVWAQMFELLRPDYKLKTRWNVKHVCPFSRPNLIPFLSANNYIPKNCTMKHKSTALNSHECMRAKYLNDILTY